MGFEQNRVMLQSSPSGCASATVMHGYSRMGSSVVSLAQYIRGMGYTAIPAKNDTGLSVPMAIDAGFGEGSRMGMVVTPEFGPNIRIAKVLTDMPLIPDKPIEFGVQKFCETVKSAPERALPRLSALGDLAGNPATSATTRASSSGTTTTKNASSSGSITVIPAPRAWRSAPLPRAICSATP